LLPLRTYNCQRERDWKRKNRRSRESLGFSSRETVGSGARQVVDRRATERRDVSNWRPRRRWKAKLTIKTRTYFIVVQFPGEHNLRPASGRVWRAVSPAHWSSRRATASICSPKQRRTLRVPRAAMYPRYAPGHDACALGNSCRGRSTRRLPALF
jgi:hypothetical protein